MGTSERSFLNGRLMPVTDRDEGYFQLLKSDFDRLCRPNRLENLACVVTIFATNAPMLEIETLAMNGIFQFNQ